MFEPLAQGILDQIAAKVRARGLRFGFGGIARLDEGLLPGRDVLAEHLRLGSGAVILSRTFHASEAVGSFEDQVRSIRGAESALAARTSGQVESDQLHVRKAIKSIAANLRQAA